MLWIWLYITAAGKNNLFKLRSSNLIVNIPHKMNHNNTQGFDYYDSIDETFVKLKFDSRFWTNLPAWVANWDQSLLTTSRPFNSCWVDMMPLGSRVTVTAAYFFFLSRRRRWKTPSTSSSRCLYSLFTSALIWLWSDQFNSPHTSLSVQDSLKFFKKSYDEIDWVKSDEL